MSERLRAKHEQHEAFKESDFEGLEEKAEKSRAEAAELAQDKSHEIDDILKKIEHEATSSAEISKKHIEKHSRDNEPAQLNYRIVSHTFTQTIHRVQNKLPVYQRAFSKLVHSNTVETASEAVGSTIARPSGLLGGGICSVLASLGTLVLCRYYGYEYNFLIGLLAFGGGFALGLILETALRLVKRGQSRGI